MSIDPRILTCGGNVGETGERFALADVKLRPPIIPKKFFHTSGNFREHSDDLARINWSRGEQGDRFFQNIDAIVGPDDPVIYPEHLTQELDYEIELAIVIGKPGKFFSAEEAVEHISGYVVFNDITARDIQRREMESGVFSFCKAIDTFCPLGPWIVTADEIDDPHNLMMELRVNGQIRQKSNTNQMSVTIPESPSCTTRHRVTVPANIITTGTIGGIRYQYGGSVRQLPAPGRCG